MFHPTVSNKYFYSHDLQIPGNRVVVTDNSVLSVRNVVPDDEDVYVCQVQNRLFSSPLILETNKLARLFKEKFFLVNQQLAGKAKSLPAPLWLTLN